MEPTVSVVVPVYNPGGLIRRGIDSLVEQSLAADRWEAIFVDDGSTDGTSAVLDQLADDRPGVVRVIHTPNSGWPGKPRNLGIEAARGQYLLFLDADDWLGEEALERLVATAEHAGADVVVGREVGHGRAVPRPLFRRNLDDATLDSAPLLSLLTPHKLFRRSTIDAAGIRFPEGRRRFEDHVFVMRAYFAARRISVLADYPCYHWLGRDDLGNASDRYAEPRAYYENMGDVLDVVDAHTKPGAARDRLYAHWVRIRALDRLRGERWAAGPGAHDLEVLDAIRELVLQRAGAGVRQSLPARHRVRWKLAVARRVDLLQAQARYERGLRARVRIRRAQLEGRRLLLELSARLLDGDSRAIRFRSASGRTLWQPPTPLTEEPTIDDDDLDATAELRASEMAVVLRHADDPGFEHDVPAAVRHAPATRAGPPTVQLSATAEVDIERVAAGLPLPAGRWDLLADVQVGGWRSVRRLVADPVPGSPRGVLQLEVDDAGVPALRAVDPPTSKVERTRRRRSSPRHPIERLIPRWLLPLVPASAKRASKELLLRRARRR